MTNTERIQANNAELREAIDMAESLPNAGGGGVQADWNQTDETAADFIKNKPFGDELTEIIPETEAVPQELDGLPAIMVPELLTMGEPDVLFVTFDGLEYILNKKVLEGVNFYGNAGMLGIADTGEPFVVVPLMCAVAVMDMQPHTLGISLVASKKLDPKYLPRTALYTQQDDNYLYKDAACTAKATIQDVPDNTDFDIGIKIESVIGQWLRPTLVYSRFMAAAMGYCAVQTANAVFFTAEYTPPTT